MSNKEKGKLRLIQDEGWSLLYSETEFACSLCAKRMNTRFFFCRINHIFFCNPCEFNKFHCRPARNEEHIHFKIVQVELP